MVHISLWTPNIVRYPEYLQATGFMYTCTLVQTGHELKSPLVTSLPRIRTLAPRLPSNRHRLLPTKQNYPDPSAIFSATKWPLISLSSTAENVFDALSTLPLGPHAMSYRSPIVQFPHTIRGASLDSALNVGSLYSPRALFRETTTFKFPLMDGPYNGIHLADQRNGPICSFASSSAGRPHTE